MTTIETAFGGRVPLVNLDKATSIPLGFVFQLPDKLAPSHIRNGLSKFVVLDHIFDLQTLDAYNLVFAYDGGREFMLIVSSPVCNLLMDTSNLETSLGSVLRTLCLFCVTALCFRQFLCITGGELGVSIRMSIRGDDHRREPQVKPNHLRGTFQGFDVFFYQ